jgi:hypothetical protein
MISAFFTQCPLATYLAAISNIARPARLQVPAHETGESWTSYLQNKTEFHLIGSMSLSLSNSALCGSVHACVKIFTIFYNTSIWLGFFQCKIFLALLLLLVLNSLPAKLFWREQNSYFLVGKYSIST